MSKNILILSAGRRVELLKIFKKSLNKNKLVNIFTADSNPKFSPACKINNNTFKLPKCSEKLYIKKLLLMCKKNNIKVVIPTIDDELLILALNKKRFLNFDIQILISDIDFIKKTTNKLLTKDVFDELKIKYPKIYDINKIKFPSINKPISGSSSRNITIIKNFKDLSINLINNNKNYFSKYIRNYKEYTADLYFDKKSNLKAISVRERLDVRNGEVVKSITNKFLSNKVKKYFTYLKGAIGPITIQFFYNNKINDMYGIEINPRLGGGCTLSFYAGINFPKLIIDEYLLKKNVKKISKINKNKLLLRYDKDLTI